MNNPILSICIPTYNRAKHVFSLVQNILSCQTDEIEVVVLDNCSTDETKKLLSSIYDNRFVFIQNPQNIGGILNTVNVLTLAKGEYALLCLDRDNINNQNILPLIDSLREENDVVLGYCTFELIEKSSDNVYEKGFDSVLNMAYLSKHPSGEFFKTAILKKLKKIEEINNNLVKFGFYHDLMNAEASFFGKSKMINIPIVAAAYLNSKDDFGVNKSHSYTNTNYYFKPDQRIFEYSSYMIHASKLNLSSKEKIKLFNAIYYRGLISATFDFKKKLMDMKICSHYRIDTRKVSFIELLKNDFYFSSSFLKQNIHISFLRKINICLYAHFKFIYLFFRRIVEK